MRSIVRSIIQSDIIIIIKKKNLLIYRLERTLDLFLVLILSYSPILYTLIAFYFLDSIILCYIYSISLVYNLTPSQFFYISL